jgi:integrase
VTRAALQLAALVFQRPGEIRKAEWAEIDLDAALWTIPGERMKRSKVGKASGPAHVVPLAAQADALLRDLQPLTGAGPFVIPGLRTDDRPMSDNAIMAALRRMGFPRDEMTGHGFRAMARTMLAERLSVDDAVIEAQLAHAVRDSLGRAYNRTEFVDQRRAMMQSWADYLDILRDGAKIVSLRKASVASPALTRTINEKGNHD